MDRLERNGPGPVKNGFREIELLRHLSEGVLVLDRLMRIRSASQKAAAMTGRRMQDLLGSFCYDVLQTDRCQGACLGEEVLRSGRSFLHIPVQVRSDASNPQWVDISIFPLKGLNGDLVGAQLLLWDYGEFFQRSSLDAGSPLGVPNLHEAITGTLQEGVLILDDTRQIIEFNQGAEWITGYRRDEVVGRRCSEVFQTNLCERGCPFKKALYLEEPLRDIEMRIRGKEERPLSVLVNLAPLRDQKGRLVGGVQTLRDVSAFEWMRHELVNAYDYSTIMGKSPAMREMYRRLEDVARTDTTVLLSGESGTGKELVARAIHFNSNRRDRPLISVNCSALPEGILESELFGHVRGAFTGAIKDKPGRFEQANGGTLFLDEVGELTPATQVKLLRVLEEGEFQRVGDTRTIRVDIRLIAAINKDLRSEVAAGRFRDDLYYRLNVFPIELPPLRERTEDLPLLVHHFIEKFNHQMGRRVQGVSGEALDSLHSYGWPGNVRELENAIEHAFVHSRGVVIQVEDLPRHLVDTLAVPAEVRPAIRDEALDSFERRLILRQLQESRWRRREAAQRLGISPVTLWRKMKKHGIREFSDEK
jgi:PAS domain S-box-containing protein